jgi:hypothetical protein
MPLQRGEVQGYDFNRSVVEFTMLNQGKVILCAISTAAMDDLEGRPGVRHSTEQGICTREQGILDQLKCRAIFGRRG